MVTNGQVLIQSNGTSVWTDVNLESGTYVMVCFIIDPATGQPHAMKGMVSLFEVGGAPAATPAS